MNPWQINWVCLLSLTLPFIAIEVRDFWDAFGISGKVRVTIYNDLPSGTNLNVHCKSKDDDLRPRVLSSQKSFHFDFHPEFWGGTLFYCQVHWHGKSHCFDAYNQEKYGDLHSGRVLWKVSNHGRCTVEIITNSTLCYQWDSNDCRQGWM